MHLSHVPTDQADVAVVACRKITVSEHPAWHVVRPGTLVVVFQPGVDGSAHHDGADAGDERVITHRSGRVVISAEEPVEGVFPGGDEAVQAGGGVVDGAGHRSSSDAVWSVAWPAVGVWSPVVVAA